MRGNAPRIFFVSRHAERLFRFLSGQPRRLGGCNRCWNGFIIERVKAIQGNAIYFESVRE
jgi:hypothetical protein